MNCPRSVVVLCALTLLSSVLLAGCLESMQDADELDAAGGDESSGMEDDQHDEHDKDPEPSDDPEDEETPDDGNGDDDSDDVNGDGDTPEAPTASVSANTTSGTEPLFVNFTLEGSVDPDATASWSFDPDDGSAPITGSELPAHHEHEYDGEGTYTAVLTVSDGVQSSEDNITIEVEEEEEPGPDPEPLPDPDAVISIVDDGPQPMYEDGTTMLPVTVLQGSVVQWNWDGSLPHSVTSDVTTGQSFDSGEQPAGSTFRVTIEEPGVYQYMCTVHVGQVGLIVALPEA